jgi:hypothetical protein
VSFASGADEDRVGATGAVVLSVHWIFGAKPVNCLLNQEIVKGYEHYKMANYSVSQNRKHLSDGLGTLMTK